MTTSDIDRTHRTDREAYVWIWLPGEVEPVVAGKLEIVDTTIQFNYGRSYLDLK